MSQWVNEGAKKTARRVCLYDFLLSKHPEEVVLEGDSLRLCCNHSVSIKSGYAGFTDFADGSTGNAIDCLINYFDYDFPDAVAALCEYEREDLNSRVPGKPSGILSVAQKHLSPQKDFVLPVPAKSGYLKLFSYLSGPRGIPPAAVRQLVRWGLLYQEAGHNNIVFVNSDRTFIEMRGSSSVPFHQVAFSDPTAFWSFRANGPDTTPTIAYICEGAIDAISLCLLRLHPPANSGLAPTPPNENGLYCSIGGVANQQRIDRIKTEMAAIGGRVVIAVDNDPAGEDCRRRNLDCTPLIPQRKDWNEDFIASIDKAD